MPFVDVTRVLPVLLAGLWSFCASACYAFIFNAEKKDVIWGAVFGAAGWMLYTVVADKTGSQGWGYTVGAFAVASGSELCAAILNRPATVFLVPGVIPLVPGGGIYTMMHEAVQAHFDAAGEAGYATAIAAGTIALGIAVASSISHFVIKLMHRHQQRILERAEESVTDVDLFNTD